MPNDPDSGRLCLLACHHFHPEVAAALSGLPPATQPGCAAFAACCAAPALTWDDLRPHIPPGCAGLLLIGQACLDNLGPPPADFPPLAATRLRDCFDLVTDSRLLAGERQNGVYLMTPGWLRSWRDHLAGWGFAGDPETFGDFASALWLLDTGSFPEAEAALAAMGQTLGLPVRRIVIGLEHLRDLIGDLLRRWQLGQAERRCQALDQERLRDQASHAAALDFFGRLARSPSEETVVAAIEELFHMLFAPQSLTFAQGDTAPVSGLNDDGTGFAVAIAHEGRTIGTIRLDGLAFPQHRERYLTEALAVADICGLAIDHVRKRARLVEAEKMAALGVLVAGVAHEVSTPLGSSLLALSALAERTEKLRRTCETGQLTRTELLAYLDAADQGGLLARIGLERIGALVEIFRKAAMNESHAPAERSFRMRQCIANVLRILTDRLAGKHLDIRVDCPETLELTGNLGDWTNILTNFVANSLTHGFQGRERGSIVIEAARAAGTFRLTYRDDGNGMSDAVLRQIFDPFYTTDHQRGIGLGLNLVYNLVTRRLGGTIQCQSAPGEGAVFVIEIPQ